ncbi:hypothetical protein LEP1GSC050_2970 [Leptospira broomii serovar Hurstbridge str. 5399]|uniref:Uncharacterized protein n=1 Tax=Leptospira broomii serovar Hurstbridge str. 5399 TaxID=1049789 RepID=T0F8R3_9LEPT|nr:hypothetical protein LEP1GSC050_2970 [Leptospira broomii serovar Hurstbridge str. 5399]
MILKENDILVLNEDLDKLLHKRSVLIIRVKSNFRFSVRLIEMKNRCSKDFF